MVGALNGASAWRTLEATHLSLGLASSLCPSLVPADHVLYKRVQHLSSPLPTLSPQHAIFGKITSI